MGNRQTFPNPLASPNVCGEHILNPTAREAKRFVHTWGRMGSGNGEFRRPLGIAVGVDDRVYVSDNDNHCIQCFESDGTFVRKWGRQGQGEGEFRAPRALAIGQYEGQQTAITHAMFQIFPLSRFPPGLLPLCAKYVGDEYVIVADTSNCRIQRFRSDGTFICKWGRKGGGESQFHHPLGCCIDVNGIIYVADTQNHRIQTFAMDGTFLFQWDTFEMPKTISIGSDEILNVVGMHPDGLHITRFQCDGTQVGIFCLPANRYAISDVIVEVENENTMIYVCTTGNNCIFKYRSKDGTLVRTWGTGGKGDGEFASPLAMAKSSNVCAEHIQLLSARRANKPLLYITDVDNHRIVAIRL